MPWRLYTRKHLFSPRGHLYHHVMHIVPATDGIEEALAILKKGGIVAHATETCYGFMCDLTDHKAVEALFVLKQRPFEQPVSGLFASIDQAKLYTIWNTTAEDFARKYLPGPLTLILPINHYHPCSLYPTPTGGPSIGVRISPHPIAQKLVEPFGLPLVTTSANLHGQPETYSVASILEQFGEENRDLALILDSGPIEKAPPSTIVDLTGPDMKIVRQGSLRIETT